MGSTEETGRSAVIRGRIGFLRPLSPEELLKLVRHLSREGEGKAEGQA